VIEEALVGSTEVIEPCLALGCSDKAVFRALTVAEVPDFALDAILRKGGFFICAELPLKLGCHQVAERLVHDVAELVSGIDIVVARIDVAVVLDGQCGAAGFAEDAQPARLPIQFPSVTSKS